MSTFIEPTSYDFASFLKYRDKIIISELPNILQVVENIAEDELKARLDPLQSSHISYLQSDNTFVLVRNDGNGRIQFMPTSPSGMKFFRGENDFHEVCKPSLFRGLSANRILIEQLKTCEFILLLESHPIVRDFLNSGYDIEPVGMAQHYGLKTNILDLTNNKWVAAFFACTKTNSTGAYELLDGSYENKMGILYSLDIEPESFGKDIIVVGAQPFERPTRQNSFAISLSEDDNFNDRKGLGIIPFKHDKESESILFDMFYRSKKLFPDDMLVDVVSQINDINEISRGAVSFCKTVYYSNVSDNDWEKYLKQTGLSIVPETTIRFDEEKLNIQYKFWCNYGRDRLMRRTQCHLVTSFKFDNF